jgi:putative phosphoribosyl transferase
MDDGQEQVSIPTDRVRVDGALGVPPGAVGLVLFAHGSGSSRFSPRNNYVARVLRHAGLGTLLMDLLTRDEDASYATRFDIRLLSQRVIAVTRWAMQEPATRDLAIGYFGASTGAAAALQAAVELADTVRAIVSRGGRPDLAMTALPRVRAPTLLIVGAKDEVVIDLNRQAYRRLQAEKDLVIVAGASHLFEEAGKLEEVAVLAVQWFRRHLAAPSAARA